MCDTRRLLYPFLTGIFSRLSLLSQQAATTRHLRESVGAGGRDAHLSFQRGRSVRPCVTAEMRTSLHSLEIEQPLEVGAQLGAVSATAAPSLRIRSLPLRVSQQRIRVGLRRVRELVVIDEEVLLGRDQERSIRHKTEVEVRRVAEITQQLRRPLRRGRQVETLRLQHDSEARRLLVLLEREHVRAVALLGCLTALQSVPVEANPVRAVSRLGLHVGGHETGHGPERTRPRCARRR